MVLTTNGNENPYIIPDSVQEQEDERSLGSGAFSFYVGSPRDILQPWGTYKRDQQLRRYYRALHNTLIQGSIAGFVKRMKATPWEIQGGPRLTFRAQEYLQDAQFESGWGMFISKVLLDYLTQDKGAFIEIMGPGDPLSDIKGRVTGLAHLDAARCYLTGNLEFPVVYYSRITGQQHRLHHSRVVHLVDMPDADEFALNWGLCALSRMIGVSNIQIGLGKYQSERLSNLPPSGLMTISGLTMDKFEQAKEYYEAARTENNMNFWSSLMALASPNPDNPLKIEVHEFSQLPEHFDFKTYMDNHVNLVALALGVDRQEIWPLSAGNLGTGTQSEVLNQKARGKGFADALTMIERALNTWVLPASLEFRFKFQDEEADKAIAERAQVWVNIANAALDLSAEQRLQLMANQVEPLADVILDADGKVKLPDLDPKEQIETEIIEPQNEDESTLDDQSPAGTEDDATAPDDARQRKHLLETELLGTGRGVHLDWYKGYDDTAAEFFRNLVDLFQAGVDGDIRSRRFDSVLRAQLTRLGRKAYIDGLAQGGVEVDALEGDDLAAFTQWLAEQNPFITNLTSAIYQNRVSETEIANRARMWTNKSLRDSYERGLLSAAANEMVEFKGSDGLESCDTCKRLKGQRHRRKEWWKKRLVPRVHTENFICGGWECSHSLEAVKGKARGRL